jgi:hypothetical protein
VRALLELALPEVPAGLVAGAPAAPLVAPEADAIARFPVTEMR